MQAPAIPSDDPQRPPRLESHWVIIAVVVYLPWKLERVTPRDHFKQGHEFLPVIEAADFPSRRTPDNHGLVFERRLN